FGVLIVGVGYLFWSGEGEEPPPRLKSPSPPRRDNRDIGFECVIGKLEAHLIVALAGRAMGNRIGPDLLGDLDLLLGNERPRNRGAEKILTLIERIGSEHPEHAIPHQSFSQI